jgi:hypothetical protein
VTGLSPFAFLSLVLEDNNLRITLLLNYLSLYNRGFDERRAEAQGVILTHEQNFRKFDCGAGIAFERFDIKNGALGHLKLLGAGSDYCECSHMRIFYEVIILIASYKINSC